MSAWYEQNNPYVPPWIEAALRQRDEAERKIKKLQAEVRKLKKQLAAHSDDSKGA